MTVAKEGGRNEMRLRGFVGVLSLSLYLLLASGCATKPSVQIHPPVEGSGSAKQVVIFLDGTRNDRDSRTNVSALSELVKHQDRDNMYMFYSEGVGTDNKFVGAGTGWGIGNDVVDAYTFLSEYYSGGSKLYIFGFSRGAYTSRILAGMIYSVGIFDLSVFPKDCRKDIAKDLYSAYKGQNDVEEIREATEEIIGRYRNKHELIKEVTHYGNVRIGIMGLWDTVEALGVVPTIEAIMDKLGVEDPQNIVNPNGRYIDQICNVDHIYHALSLDDNRANVFTPIILSSKEAAKYCEGSDRGSLAKVEEVWFSGAHADVGGGYDKNENNSPNDTSDRDINISGVSLNWMISHIHSVAPELLPINAKVYENRLGYIHDAEKGSSIYKRITRKKILKKYKNFSRYGKLRIHDSVFERLSQPTKVREELGYSSKWYKMDEFENCFDVTDDGRYIFKSCEKIEKVSNRDDGV